MPVTLSEQLLFTGLGAGAIVGFRWGYLDFGMIGGTGGGLLGLVTGGVVGGLPYFILGHLLRRELREMSASSTEHLRTRLRADYLLSHYILIEGERPRRAHREPPGSHPGAAPFALGGRTVVRCGQCQTVAARFGRITAVATGRDVMEPKLEAKLACLECKRPCPHWAALGRGRDIAKLKCPLCGGALAKQEKPKSNGKS